ncbi:MAG: proprotein convertase P-domain-containing protein [Phycisphaerales bacterium]|nr:proprotein convertase P-domain-containing protein [Phycisphaerales bacterium]MCB9854899.1 proprotein convertase P-domain-containing protein [Phycisphaerales bacterium]MCB9864402.1 proprotein convertase P-domain-containing protein [Phycisphaerales bacterium]
MTSRASRRIACIAALAAALFATALSAAADNWYAITPDGVRVKESVAAVAPDLRIVADEVDRLEFTIQVDGLRVNSFKTIDGAFVNVDWPGAAVCGEIGAPAIPVVRNVFVAPTGAVVTARVESAASAIRFDASIIGDSIRLAPVRAPIPKIPGAIEQARYLCDPSAYAIDAATPAETVRVSELGVVRGRRLMLVEVFPVQYNPAQQTLDVCPDMQVVVEFQTAQPQAVTHSVLPGLPNVVLNPARVPVDKAQTGNYLVIVADAFADQMEEFNLAKSAQGFKVSTWTAAAGVTTTQIATFIATQWADPNNAPDYILLVGDTNTIPNWTGGGDGTPPTDLPYTCMDGAGDWFPDIAIGRFPVRSAAQLAAVIDKTLYLENGPLADPSYLSRAVFMASEDNYSVSEGTHEYCITNYMDPNNFEYEKLYSHTYNATTQQSRDAFNSGRIFGIYSGHGSETSWADGPVFTQSDVNGLLNTNLYPFVCSFACVTGNYTITECFCETWILAPNKGAAAIWGSSVNSYWTEDDVLQKTLFSVFYDDYIRELGPAFNQTRVRYAAQMGSDSTTRRYFEMYNLFGDPSLLIPDAEAALRVSPSGLFRTEGPEGGPFTPASMMYTLRNVSAAPIDYEVTHEPAASWVTLDGVLTGSLGAGETLDITATINASADVLPIGAYTDTISFANLTDHVGDATRDISLEVGRYVFNAIDVPKPITDYNTSTSTMTVDQHFCIGDLNLSLDLTHTYVGDLIVRLQSPSGTTVTLHNRTGGGSSNLQLTYDDEGTPPDGPGALADFDRQSPLGIWTLTVSDEAGGDSGTLNGWTLRILPLGEVCPPAANDMSFHTQPNIPVDITLQGMTEGAGPLTYTIESLPANGTIRDMATNIVVDTAPYSLSGNGNAVRYQPTIGYNGVDVFTYFVSDDTGQSDPATVAIDVGGPEPIHVFDMNVDPSWTATGAWAYGQPTGGGSHNLDPTSGYTGTHVVGFNLSGDYSDNMASTQYLTTKAIDCTGITDVQLRFRRWLGIESASYDHANIQVSNNGTTWTTIWEHTGAAVSETSWSLQTYDIAAIADNQETMYIRWGMGPTDGSVTYPGWNIDDVEIWGRQPAPPMVLGDMNCDGVCDIADVAPFSLALVDADAYAAVYPDCTMSLADANSDTVIDGNDLQTFVELLLFGD